MSTYIYEDGATHHDHHKEMTVNVTGKTDIVALMKAFMAEDATEAEVVETEADDSHEESDTSGDDIFRDALDMPKVQEAHDEAVQAVSKPRTGGRKPESLFKDRKGERDEERTRAKASDFVGYLKKQGLLGMTIDTRRDNETNKAFVEFYQRWVDEENVSSYPNGSACYRFLKEDCALQMASEENGYMKTYGEFIRKMILDA